MASCNPGTFQILNRFITKKALNFKKGHNNFVAAKESVIFEKIAHHTKLREREKGSSILQQQNCCNLQKIFCC